MEFATCVKVRLHGHCGKHLARNKTKPAQAPAFTIFKQIGVVKEFLQSMLSKNCLLMSNLKREMHRYLLAAGKADLGLLKPNRLADPVRSLAASTKGQSDERPAR